MAAEIHSPDHESQPSDDERQLAGRLESLETCLESPIVAGELVAWFDAASNAMSQLGPVLLRQITGVHPQQFAQIAAEDAALQPHTDRLQNEDQELLRAFDALMAQAAWLSKRASQIEPDEARLRSEATQFSQQGLALIIRTRKQEAAIRTWFVEALNRDSGVVD